MSVFGDALKHGWLISNEPLPEAQAEARWGFVKGTVFWMSHGFYARNVLVSADFDNLFLWGWRDCLHSFLMGSECCRKTLLNLIRINLITSQFGDALSELASNLVFWLKSSRIEAGFD